MFLFMYVVTVGRNITNDNQVMDGLWQGHPLSKISFNLPFEKVLRDANSNRSGLLYCKRHKCIAYADDIAIVSRGKKN